MFSKGDLVRWYKLYDDISIVRETGIGIVLEKRIDLYGEYEVIIYTVHVTENNTTEIFEEFCLEKIKENKDETK